MIEVSATRPRGTLSALVSAADFKAYRALRARNSASLNLNVTQGASFNDVLAALGSGQALNEFRLPATTDHIRGPSGGSTVTQGVGDMVDENESATRL